MQYSPMRPSDPEAPYAEVWGVYITYLHLELDALRHLLEFLRKRFAVSEADLEKAKNAKRGRPLKKHPICQICDTIVSLPRLISIMYNLEELAGEEVGENFYVTVGFRFETDRTTFRVYKKELGKTTGEDLETARDVYDIVCREYFPDKEKLN